MSDPHQSIAWDLFFFYYYTWMHCKKMKCASHTKNVAINTHHACAYCDIFWCVRHVFECAWHTSFFTVWLNYQNIFLNQAVRWWCNQSKFQNSAELKISCIDLGTGWWWEVNYHFFFVQHQILYLLLWTYWDSQFNQRLSAHFVTLSVQQLLMC